MVVSSLEKPTSTPSNLEQYLLRHSLDRFVPFLSAEQDEQIEDALEKGNFLAEGGGKTNPDFYELFRRAVHVISPSRGSVYSGDTLNWGHLIMGNYDGSLGVHEYGKIVSVVKNTLKYLKRKSIYSYAEDPLNHWLEQNEPLVPMLEDANSRHKLLAETPSIVGGLPYYLVHDNNRFDEGSLIHKIFDARTDLSMKGDFTRKFDQFAFDAGIHMYSYYHIQNMTRNFVEYVNDYYRKIDSTDEYEKTHKLQGLELRSYIARKLAILKERGFADKLEYVKEAILSRPVEDKPHPDEYPPTYTSTYRSIIYEIDNPDENRNYDSGIVAAEQWLADVERLNLGGKKS